MATDNVEIYQLIRSLLCLKIHGTRQSATKELDKFSSMFLWPSMNPYHIYGPHNIIQSGRRISENNIKLRQLSPSQSLPLHWSIGSSGDKHISWLQPTPTLNWFRDSWLWHSRKICYSLQQCTLRHLIRCADFIKCSPLWPAIIEKINTTTVVSTVVKKLKWPA